MSSSSSATPGIILGVIAIVILGGFYYLDRSSSNSTDVNAIKETADTEGATAKKEKYETQKSVFSHSGFKGSVEDYLTKFNDDMASSDDVEAHSGYSGSGSDYVEQHGKDEVGKAVENAAQHSGFSGSLDDYSAGNYDTASNDSSSKPAESKNTSKKSSSSSNSGSHSGYSGSVDGYLNKYQ